MNGIVPERIKNKGNFILNMSQLQKEKIAASRNNLFKILNKVE